MSKFLKAINADLVGISVPVDPRKVNHIMMDNITQQFPMIMIQCRRMNLMLFIGNSLTAIQKT